MISGSVLIEKFAVRLGNTDNLNVRSLERRIEKAGDVAVNESYNSDAKRRCGERSGHRNAKPG